MKMLTIIATISTPLTFIAGIYEMNFQNMPELKWHFGHEYSLLLMAGISLALILFMRRKKMVLPIFLQESARSKTNYICFC